MNQKDAVFAAIVSVLGHTPTTAVELTESQKPLVYDILVKGFMNGEIAYKSDFDEAIIRKYVPGLVNNWMRKDKRLNGNTEYQAKNPGSRTGAGDERLKALRALLAAVPDDVKPTVQAEIDKRLEELKPSKTINVAALPEHLRHLV